MGSKNKYFEEIKYSVAKEMMLLLPILNVQLNLHTNMRDF